MAIRLKRWLTPTVVLFGIGFGCISAEAGDLKISLPRRSELTPVQKLNREGVDAVRKHQYRKAEAFFYKAYLFDPDDPFTLNNLGYMAEMKGQVDRAEKFYALASQQATGAVIDQSSLSGLKGKPLRDAISEVADTRMRINQANVEAIRLLSQGRAAEAEALVQRVLRLDSRNPFTLNNMGLAKEMQGDFAAALKYYTEVASSKSEQAVVVTLNSRWRGKPVWEMAADSARKLRARMQEPETSETRAAELNLQGVSAINRNDWSEAAQDFREAYRLDPESAFSLNNSGFLAEMYGDPETAQVFYGKAREAQGQDLRVGVATRSSAEGLKLSEVARDNDQKMDDSLESRREARRRQTGPIQLKRRDNTPVVEPARPAPSPEPPALGPPQPPIPQLEPPKPQPAPPANPNDNPHL